MAKAAKPAKVKKAAKPAENKVVKAAKAKVETVNKMAKRTDGARERVMAILTAFDAPVMKSEITQRMTLWTRESREAALSELVSKKKIISEVIGTGRRGRPGTQFSLAA